MGWLSLLRSIWPRFVPSPEEDSLDGSAPDHEHEPPDDELAPLAIGSDGWARGDGVELIPTKRGGYVWRTASKRPGGILWHWTATAHGTARAIVKHGISGKGPTVHFWIDGDGSIVQQVPTRRGAAHAGGASSAKLRETDGAIVKDATARHSANSFLIGVELVNIGEVRAVGGRWMGWPFAIDGGKGPVVPAADVVEVCDRVGQVRYYHRFTAEQIVSAERLTRALVDKYGFTRAASSWGHVDVDPTRKSDPGPLWQMVEYPRILERVFDERR